MDRLPSGELICPRVNASVKFHRFLDADRAAEGEEITFSYIDPGTDEGARNNKACRGILCHKRARRNRWWLNVLNGRSLST